MSDIEEILSDLEHKLMMDGAIAHDRLAHGSPERERAKGYMEGYEKAIENIRERLNNNEEH